ncbi:M24 family metallopeptidase [Ferruginibacter sp.]
MTEAKLLHAENITRQLFDAIDKNGLIKPGRSEAQLVSEITQLAAEKFGITQHWHKKIVRAGSNTLATYSDDPTDRIIEENDIVFVDLGPIVDGYEADMGRTYVLGNDAVKLQLKQDVENAWYEIQSWYKKQNAVKAADLFKMAVDKAKNSGWEFTGVIAGHIVGKYPHEQPADPKSWELDIHPENHDDIFLKDAEGNKRYWILELQFIDKEKNIGAYFEQLLDASN